MKPPILEIKDLHVEISGAEILRGLNLVLEKNQVHALMGPNGSGKSTLAHALMGHPSYKITKGKIIFDGKDITKENVTKKAKLGIFLSFQYPQEISGVTITSFLRTAYNSLKEERLSIFRFKKLIREKARILGIKEEFLDRYINEGFSGGEKKKTEILQMLVLDPKLAILDETDSGLDIDALKVVSRGVNEFKKSKDKTILIITHYKRILENIIPDKVSILVKGKIEKQGDGSIVEHLEEKGYGWIEEV